MKRYMTSISVNINEGIHHVCLIYGLKKAYSRYPSLTHNILAPPPPFMRNPRQKRMFIGNRLDPVSVQYYKNEITVIFDAVAPESVTEFTKAIVEEYFSIRHPYTEYRWDNYRFISSTEDIAAEII